MLSRISVGFPFPAEIEYKPDPQRREARQRIAEPEAVVLHFEMEQYRDYDKFEKCGKCELKQWCRGCPAVANGMNDSFYAADPQCWKEL